MLRKNMRKRPHHIQRIISGIYRQFAIKCNAAHNPIAFIQFRIWSVIALAISIWIPDKLLVVAIPAAIFYIWNADISFYVFGVPLPSPASLFNDSLSVQRMAITLLMYAVAFAVSAGGFYFGCRRRCQHV